MIYNFHARANVGPSLNDAARANVQLSDTDLAAVSGGGDRAKAWGVGGGWFGGMAVGACIGGPVGAILGAPVGMIVGGIAGHFVS